MCFALYRNRILLLLIVVLLLQREDIQRVVLEEVVLKLIGSEDGRVRTAAGEALSK